MARVSLSVLSFALLAACASASPSSSSEGAMTFPDAPYGALATEPTHLSVELRTAPSQPPVRGTSAAELRVSDAAGIGREGLVVTVTPWMPAHGHGTAVSPVVTAQGGGVYVVENLALPMPGTWELRIAMTGEGGFEDHATTTLEVR